MHDYGDIDRYNAQQLDASSKFEPMSTVEKALVATDRCMSHVVKLGVDDQHALRGHVIVFGQEGAQVLYERRRVVPDLASVYEHMDVCYYQFFQSLIFFIYCFFNYYATVLLS